MSVIEFKVDAEKVEIEVTPELKTRVFDVLIGRGPGDMQNKKYNTVMEVLAAAYKAGQNSN